MKGPVAWTRIDRPFAVFAEREEVTEIGPGKPMRLRSYDVKIPFVSIEGRAATGTARLLVPEVMKPPTPIVITMHYQMGLPGVDEFLREGWLVMTPLRAFSMYGDSVNFNLATIQAARAMPFVDPKRIALTGNSAGGYMTLMAASEMFPIVAAMPHVPLVNTAYNTAFALENARIAECGSTDAEGKNASAVPVFCSVIQMVRAAARPIGDPNRQAANFIRNAPVGVVDLITCPVSAEFSTADTLVPINQVDARYARPTPPSFPEGFSFDMDKLVKHPAARLTLLQALKDRSVAVLRVRLPHALKPMWELTPPVDPRETPRISFPFSARTDFSVCVIDEGAPDPRLGHLKHNFRFSGLSFAKHWASKSRPLKAEQLTAVKLAVLMRRFLGENFEGVKNYHSATGKVAAMNRRNRPSKERLDVILGLRAYCATDPRYSARLAQLYARLAPELRALDARKRRMIARFENDISGGLAFHEALLHHRWGDKDTARRLARRLVRAKGHAAYTACLPRPLRLEIGP